MENFVAYNPTKVIFGKGCISKLAHEVSQYGSRALVLIGRGSVKTNGILSQVLAQLEKANVTYSLFEGIKSNPIYQDADRAVAQARAFKAEVIVAVGGGSVIDSAKAIAVGYYVEHSVWDFYIRKAPAPQRALPILAVLTLAATGTEMNMFTVLQNDATKQKVGYGSPLMYPKVSFLDPEFTYSVSANYTAYGIADLISHCLEQYFDKSHSPLSDSFTIEAIRLAMEYGIKVMENLYDYDARANLMWLATVALNGALSAGKKGGDWGVHAIEHTLSVLFDIPHGAGLSIVYPAWLKYFYPQIESKLTLLAQRIISPAAKAQDFIQHLEEFYQNIQTPIRLREVNILPDKHNLILDNLVQTNANGSFFKMKKTDYEQIIQLMS
ncbi:MAG: iron-containing alcohol dehydrogenase [Microscillaceae bacterium]|nr:iron-containing alcohol dehydrogenase [Microscillaceae bacterium]MDW8461744.1 iron-containing alcohol dehydrogenase [Cytophagales bacterium]